MSDRRVFVTGASGFVGTVVLPELFARRYVIRALRHRSELPGEVTDVVDGSLTNVADLESSLDGVESVVHCAALLDPIDDERSADLVNHRATLELARAAARAGVRSFVFLSSLAAVGYHDRGVLVRPDTTCRPTTIYGHSKLAAERALQALDAPGMRTVILRPPTVYGPGERRNFLALVRAIDTGYFVIPGDGKNRMSFCAAANLAHAIGFCVENANASGVVHVADEPIRSFRETVHTIARALGRRILPVPFPIPAARVVATALEVGFAMRNRTPPLSRARLETLTADSALDTGENTRIGLVPIVGFEHALAETILEYRSAGLVRRR